MKQLGYQVEIFAAELGLSQDLQAAVQITQQGQIRIHQHFLPQQSFDCHIDALFGIGLKRQLDEDRQQIIDTFNAQSGVKIAIDIPSGLNANTRQPLPMAVIADHTFTVLGLKAGLFTGQGKAFAGQIEAISLIPTDAELQALAQLSPTSIKLPKRQAFGHKGSYGHVLVVGGHADMGGAVMMAAESAFSAGAGKVTIVCDAKHHTAIVARAPNIMIRDINHLTQSDIQTLIDHVDAVCFGMGLGRDEWAAQQFSKMVCKNKESHTFTNGLGCRCAVVFG